jgi:hypothetical protein
LHELAHSLHVDIELEGNTDRQFSIYYYKWKQFALGYIRELKNGHISFLRKYGATSIHEFFAVCIEHFFEAPAEFQAAIPELYQYMVAMLNQDPLNVNADYSISIPTISENAFNQRKFKILDANVVYPRTEDAVITRKDKWVYFFKTEGLNLAMTITLIGLFAGIPTLFWLAGVTVIETHIIILMLIISTLIGMTQWRFVKKYIDLAFYQFVMYAFAGFGMCLLNIILLLNYFIKTSSDIESYNVDKFKFSNKTTELTIYSDGFETGIERNLSIYLHEHYESLPTATKAIVKFDKGLFGFKSVREVDFY